MLAFVIWLSKQCPLQANPTVGVHSSDVALHFLFSHTRSKESKSLGNYVQAHWK